MSEMLTDDVMRRVLVVLPPPDSFAAYRAAVRERLMAVLPAELDKARLRCGQCGDDLLPGEIEGHLNAEGRTSGRSEFQGLVDTWLPRQPPRSQP